MIILKILTIKYTNTVFNTSTIIAQTHTITSGLKGFFIFFLHSVF